MMTAAKLKFPPLKYEIGSGDYRFHDDIIDFLKERRLGFTPGFENITGKQVVKGLSDALFYIQPFNGRISNFVPSLLNRCKEDYIYTCGMVVQ